MKKRKNSLYNYLKRIKKPILGRLNSAPITILLNPTIRIFWSIELWFFLQYHLLILNYYNYKAKKINTENISIQEARDTVNILNDFIDGVPNINIKRKLIKKIKQQLRYLFLRHKDLIYKIENNQ